MKVVNGQLKPGVHPRDIDMYVRQQRSPGLAAMMDGIDALIEMDRDNMTEEEFTAELDRLQDLLPDE